MSDEEVPRFRPSKEPAEITHKRYTHRKDGYVVTVLCVRNYRGRHGYHTVIEVQGSRRDKKKIVTWPALVFLRVFQPKGRKLRIKSRYERLMDRDNI